MKELYRYAHPATLTCSNFDDLVRLGKFGDSNTSTTAATQVGDLLQFENAMAEYDPQLVPTSSLSSDFDVLIKTQIANHPRYPQLLSAYLDCRKVGAPSEMASLLEEIGREQNYTASTICSDIGVDPELDEFMDSYCEILQRYKVEISKPYDEATSFLTNIESQLNNLCNDSLITKSFHVSVVDETAAGSHSPSPAEESGGKSYKAAEHKEISGGNEDIKRMLLCKYSGYLSNLREEFMKKRKIGKLPKDAKSTLLNWWNSHYQWPYPTEEEKMKIAEITGLEEKQINNWFINQRKRHWKPLEDIRVAVMEGTTTVSGPAAYFDAAEPNYTIAYLDKYT